MDSLLQMILASLVALIIGALAGRISIRTKTDVRTARLENEVYKHALKDERDKTIILKSLLAIMITLKEGRANGELKEAMGELNDYFINESAKQPVEKGE